MKLSTQNVWRELAKRATSPNWKSLFVYPLIPVEGSNGLLGGSNEVLLLHVLVVRPFCAFSSNLSGRKPSTIFSRKDNINMKKQYVKTTLKRTNKLRNQHFVQGYIALAFD